MESFETRTRPAGLRKLIACASSSIVGTAWLMASASMIPARSPPVEDAKIEVDAVATGRVRSCAVP
jgi:hypothetical protein